jgi:LCP family protein required for cell wall assembly
VSARRLLAVILALSSWIAGSVTGSFGAASVASGAPLLEIGRAHADYVPSLTGNKPIFILLLGSDARPGTPVEHGLSDSIHILGINPARHRATLLGFPRDSWVPLATGGTNKINAAMPQGGPQAEIQTVERLTGITFDYYALTGFFGLTRVVDELGGITVDVPYFIDGYNHNYEPGVQRLNGSEALGFARTRKTLPRGDFDRSENQGRLMLAALTQFRKEFRKDPSRMFAWLGAGIRNVRTDLGLDELIRLAFTATQIAANRVTNMVVPGTTGTMDGKSVVFLSSSAGRLYDDLAADGFILPS